MVVLRFIYRFLLDALQGILVIVAFLLILYVFVVKTHEVDGMSMLPTLQDKEFVLSYLLPVRFDTIQRGDIVVFDSPTEENRLFIKRVIAFSNDTILIENGSVFVNGVEVNEKAYLSESVKTYGGAFLRDGEEKIVPEGSLFVMGDNRGASSDSREWGFLDKKALIGRSLVKILPFDKFTIIKNPFDKK